MTDEARRVREYLRMCGHDHNPFGLSLDQYIRAAIEFEAMLQDPKTRIIKFPQLLLSQDDGENVR